MLLDHLDGSLDELNFHYFSIQGVGPPSGFTHSDVSRVNVDNQILFFFSRTSLRKGNFVDNSLVSTYKLQIRNFLNLES